MTRSQSQYFSVGTLNFKSEFIFPYLFTISELSRLKVSSVVDVGKADATGTAVMSELEVNYLCFGSRIPWDLRSV